ncbi:LytR/AlgR family response regulator transcription factor [Hutsoniella sourekii]|uniref:LytR/AlgR family response regulator transcription factor n=1 Tax=Hutsoniella sourekii TaxID=87650 RepID=UPI00048440E1|nr:LytTR family DNA-binding domain-containing protein [Hutsoniella sourekii]
MIPIIICEDKESQLQKISNFVENILLIEDLPMTISLKAQTSQEVKDYLDQRDPKFSIFILDIELEEVEGGLKLARYIRQRDDQSKIIFVTAYSEYLPLTYQYHIEAFGYIVKTQPELMKEMLAEALITAHQRNNSYHYKRNLFTIKQQNRIQTFDLDDIFYFTTAPISHKVVMVAKTGIFEFYDSLSKVEQANHSLIRVHKSYVVNSQHIRSLDRNTMTIILSDDHQIPVSRQCVSVVETILDHQK